ncbi:MAG: carboxy terminal-processing peptidase [Pontibacterium sp.]
MRKSFIKLCSALGLAAFISLSPAFAVANTPLAAQTEQKQTMLEIMESLKQGHYKRMEVNDALSEKLLTQYISDLDPSRSYFYQRDIKAFNKYQTTLDDALTKGNLDAAYEIFNRYQQRNIERLNYAISLLDGKHTFNFEIDESLNAERDEAPWIQSEADMNELWRKRIKSGLLSLKLADKTIAEATEILLKRYNNQLGRSEQVNNEDVFQSYANALTAQYDPHTQYFSPRRSENFQINMSLSLEGIGAVLQSENEFTKIVRLVPAGPADKTGQLKPADLILGVGQGDKGEIEDVVGWRLDDVVQKIRGPKDSVIRLQVRASDTEDAPLRIVRIIRNKVKLEEQSAQKRILEIDHQGQALKLGVIEIPTFYIDFNALQRGDENYKSTTRDVEKLIKELQTEDINGLIIDLRNNGGGSLREANELVGLFISRGPTVQIRDQQGYIRVLGDRDPKIAWSGPVAVMVNRLSASASEIFAGAMQDYQRAIVIGDQTFGKGTVQTLQPLQRGQLKMTNAKFYRISGESTQHKGVIPDITFPTLYDHDEIGESALEGALVWDQVHKAPHGQFVGASSFIQALTQQHKARISKNPDFLFMNEQVAELKKRRDKREISLQESAVQQERSATETWQIEAENRRRTLKKLAPVKTLSELDTGLKKDAQGRPINPEAEAMLIESGHILMDMLALTQKYTAASH